jgi:hypothetical protein
MQIRTKFNLGDKVWAIREKNLPFQISDPRPAPMEVLEDRVTVRSLEIFRHDDSNQHTSIDRNWYMCSMNDLAWDQEGQGEYWDEKDLFSTRQEAEKEVKSRNKKK